MPFPTPVELKRALIREGFEIYRTLPDRVVLADRVRDNLIMDSGVAAGTGEQLRVCVVLRAQALEFPGESADSLLQRARALGAALVGRGYVEVGTDTVLIRDPGDPERILDTWYEVRWERPADDEAGLTAELRHALLQTKVVTAATGT